MTTKTWKKIARLLKEVYAEIEKEALSNGVDIFSDEYTEVLNKARARILNKMGFTEEEYLSMKEEVAVAQKSEVRTTIEKTKQELQSQIDELKSIRIPSEKEIQKVVDDAVEARPVPVPQITNQIVKEITHEKIIEQPKIIETVREIKTTERVEYDAKPLEDKLKELSRRIDEIKIPEIPDVESIFQKNFKHNIDIYGMPDFRKLAMGIQGQIDEIKRDLQDDNADDTSSGTITRTSNLVSSIALVKELGTKNITVNRSGTLISNIVSVYNGITKTTTLTRDGNNKITSFNIA